MIVFKVRLKYKVSNGTRIVIAAESANKNESKNAWTERRQQSKTQNNGLNSTECE